MLNRFADKVLATSAPWTNVYGLARTLIASATAITLLVNNTKILFRPLAGTAAAPPWCGSSLQKHDLFCTAGAEHLELARWIAIIVLLVVASGWRPRITGVLHWYVVTSLQLSATVIDGGDQTATVLSCLLLPLTLTDPRKWHWDPAPSGDTNMGPFAKALGLSAMIAIRLQVAGIYFHAGIGKLRVAEWLDGTALFYWLRHPHFGANSVFVPILRPLLANGFTVALLTWGVIAAEAFLSAGILASRPAKRVLLVIGLFLHAGILLLHGISSFALTMFGALILYLRPTDELFALPAAAAVRAKETLATAWRRAPRREAGTGGLAPASLNVRERLGD